MIALATQAQADPRAFQAYPTTTPVTRPDETLAARKPNVATLPTS